MSAVVAVNIALDTVLTAAGIAFYAGTVPPGVNPPYVVSADDSESERGYHARLGSDTLVNLHMWHSTKMGALDLYLEVWTALNRVALDVEGMELERGRVRLVATLHDPVTELYHVMAEYRAETLAGSE